MLDSKHSIDILYINRQKVIAEQSIYGNNCTVIIPYRKLTGKIFTYIYVLKNVMTDIITMPDAQKQ